ncbi:MAG: SMC-Scp complex subunit ScpB [Brevinematia bacterium]
MTPEGLVESVLFVSGRKVKKDFIDSLVKKNFGLGDIEFIISNLNSRYESYGSGIRILSTGDYVEMVSSDEYYDILNDIFPQNNEDELSDVLLETLTIVAYKQPIEKSEIDKIRGISSSKALSILMEKGFIKPVKNSNISDKVSYITTEKFLDYFGLSDLGDLPNIELLKSSLNK